LPTAARSGRGGGNPAAQEELPSPSYILLSEVEEYARRYGHADPIRESVDGLVEHDLPG